MSCYGHSGLWLFVSVFCIAFVNFYFGCRYGKRIELEKMNKFFEKHVPNIDWSKHHVD